MRPTTELRRALKARFFPYAAARGFVIDERRGPQSTTFRRRVGQAVQIFEVQWEKYGRPRFTVHFGTCPADGLDVNGAIHPPDETLATWCRDAGTVRARRWPPPREWFRQDSSMSQRLLGRPPLRNAAAVVSDVLALFPELEHYWASGEVGPHLRHWHPNAANPTERRSR